MAFIRNWRDATPVVSHESAIVWSVLSKKGAPGKSEAEAPMEGLHSLTLHLMQSGKNGDYHQHDDKDQLYYFTRGHGKMKIDGEVHDVREGDAVYVPVHSWHQLINDSDDWVEHLIISGRIDGPG